MISLSVQPWRLEYCYLAYPEENQLLDCKLNDKGLSKQCVVTSGEEAQLVDVVETQAHLERRRGVVVWWDGGMVGWWYR